MVDPKDNSILVKIKRIRLIPAIGIVSLMTVLLCITDYLSGSEISFSIFYLIPITLAVFLYGKNLGFAFALVCVIAGIGADLASNKQYSSIFILVWNAMVRLGYYIFHTFLISELLETIKSMRNLSLHDPLTKTANWRYFEEYANTALRNAAREKQKIALAYIDIDNFKSVNDTYGHGGGDDVLKTIAATIAKEIRPSDLLARLGGDEFSVILTNCDYADARDVFERIERTVRAEMAGRKWNVTMSLGAMVFSAFPPTIGPMIKMVDDLMYEVKKSGKNRIKLIEQIT